MGAEGKEMSNRKPLKQYYNRILDFDIFSTHEIRELETYTAELEKKLEIAVDTLQIIHDSGLDSICDSVKLVSKVLPQLKGESE